MTKEISKKENKAILFSTHDIGLSMQISTRVLLVEAKEVVQDSPEKMAISEAFKKQFSGKDFAYDPTTFSIKIF